MPDIDIQTSGNKAVILLSGGVDSTTLLHFLRKQGIDDIYALSFLYGQKHDRELEAANARAKAAKRFGNARSA